MLLAAILLALQAPQPAGALAVSPPDQSVEAYQGEWDQAVRQWRACYFPRETYRYVQSMADALVQTKAYAAQGLTPERIEPEFSALQDTREQCLTLAAEMEPIIEAFTAAQDRPGLLRPWRAPRP
ncbi:hypothetical protein [Euryhalocaulis caribicus]|uniref:hypothetical protein n=1 Tax=Euryhalocaulis caribicus TaxID=1161401 RepID=UPI00039BB85F|nr:hypothetical protein [Euryhalocaulis caribicus]